MCSVDSNCAAFFLILSSVCIVHFHTIEVIPAVPLSIVFSMSVSVIFSELWVTITLASINLEILVLWNLLYSGKISREKTRDQ